MQPFDRRVERPDSLRSMEAGIDDDLDSARPGRKRDDPDPIALAEQIVRARHADAALLHARMPIGIIGPAVDVEPAVDAKPRRADGMADVLREAELAFEQARAARCVDDPARPDLDGRAVTGHGDGVLLVSELHVLGSTAFEDVDARLDVRLPQSRLETATVEVVGVLDREIRRAPLVSRRDVVVAVRGEEEPLARLSHLVALEMVPQSEHVGEVVRADLDRRLADLEGAVSRRAAPLLDHGDARVWTGALQLSSERQAGKAAAEDDDVVAVPRTFAHAYVGLFHARFVSSSAAHC